MADDDSCKNDKPCDDDEAAHLLGGSHRSLGLHVAIIVGNLWSVACVRIGVASKEIQMADPSRVKEVGVDACDDAAAEEGADEDHHSAGVHDDGEREAACGIEADHDIEYDRGEAFEDGHGPEIFHPEAGGQVGIEKDIIGDKGREADEQEYFRIAFIVIPAKTE